LKVTKCGLDMWRYVTKCGLDMWRYVIFVCIL
jgi:hypothetical protein